MKSVADTAAASYENAAGNTGFDEIAVTLEKRVIPGSVAGGGATVAVNIAFDADPSIDTRDELRYYYGEDDENAVTLTEALPVIRWGTQGSGPGQFNHPMSVAVLGDAVFVLDNGNARVQKFTKTGSFCSSAPIESTGSFCGICASGGFIYAADDGTYEPPPGTSVPGAIFKIDPNAMAVVERYADDLLSHPWNIAADPSGNIYAVVPAQTRIVKRSAATGAWSVWKDDFAVNAWAMAISADGIAYVIELYELGGGQYGRKISRFDLDAEEIPWTAGSDILAVTNAWAVAVDVSGRIYVCDPQAKKVLRFSADGALQAECSAALDAAGFAAWGMGVSDGSAIYGAEHSANRVFAIRNTLTFVSDDNNLFFGADVEVKITKINGADPAAFAGFDPEEVDTITAVVTYTLADGSRMSFEGEFEEAVEEEDSRVFHAQIQGEDGGYFVDDDTATRWDCSVADRMGSAPGEFLCCMIRGTSLPPGQLSDYGLALDDDEDETELTDGEDGYVYAKGSKAVCHLIRLEDGTLEFMSYTVKNGVPLYEHHPIADGEGKAVAAKVLYKKRREKPVAQRKVQVEEVLKYAAGTTVRIKWLKNLDQPVIHGVEILESRKWWGDWQTDGDCTILNWTPIPGGWGFDIDISPAAINNPRKELRFKYCQLLLNRTASIHFEVTPLRVVIVAVDGLGYGSAQEAINGSLEHPAAPTFQRLFENAAGGDQPAVSALPSITYTNWASIFSGSPPNVTGWTGNAHFPREVSEFAAVLSKKNLTYPVCSSNTSIDQKQSIGIVRQSSVVSGYAASMRNRCISKRLSFGNEASNVQEAGSIYEPIGAEVGSPREKIMVQSVNVFLGDKNNVTANVQKEYFGSIPWWPWKNTHCEEFAEKLDKETGEEGAKAWMKKPDILSLFFPGPDSIAHDIGAVAKNDWIPGELGDDINPLPSAAQQIRKVTDTELKRTVDLIEKQGYLNACLFVLVADHGMMAYWNTDDFNITPADDGGEELQLVFKHASINTELWLGDKNISNYHAVYSPNGGMVQIYLKDVPEGEPPQPTSWHEAPSKARIEQVASLLYREATGQSQIYPELAPRTQTPVTQGAFGYPPAIFVKTSEGGDGFMQDFKWAKLDQQGNFVLDTIANYLTAAQKNWPDFAQRLDELNHKYANGSRTGDIVIVMNGKQGYLGVTKQDQLNGWHGGPTRAESDVPLMFGMPGPDLLPETSDKLDAAYHQIAKRPNSSYYRNWQMGEILLNMLKQFRQKP